MAEHDPDLQLGLEWQQWEVVRTETLWLTPTGAARDLKWLLNYETHRSEKNITIGCSLPPSLPFRQLLLAVFPGLLVVLSLSLPACQQVGREECGQP